MTTTVTKPETKPPSNDYCDGLFHIADTCCPPPRETLCGQRLSGADMLDALPPGAMECVVCADLDKNIRFCPQCGQPW